MEGLLIIEQARSGEVVTSARAMNEMTMKALWQFVAGTEQEEAGPLSRKRKAEDPTEWTGLNIRRMLYLLYLVSMLCLLRYDEALHITWADVTFQVRDSATGPDEHWLDATPDLIKKSLSFKPEDFRILLNLPFRKTHQYGGE